MDRLEEDIPRFLETLFDVGFRQLVEIGLRRNARRFDGNEEVVIAVDHVQGDTPFFVDGVPHTEAALWQLPH